MTNKNFTITGVIFNEIEEVEFNGENFDEYYELLHQLGENELGEEIKNYDSEEDYEQAVQEEMDVIICVKRISVDGILYNALLKWFNRNSKSNSNGYAIKVLNNVRSAVIDGEYLYYVTGCGYDTIDNDLLNGNGSGHTRHEFLDWINS